MTKIKYGYDIKYITYPFDLDRTRNVKLLHQFSCMGEKFSGLGYDFYYSGQFYSTFRWDYYPGEETDMTKIFTHFQAIDAPIMFYLFEIPRKDLEKALDEEEDKTGKRTYTKEDLDVLYSYDFEKMEWHFLSPYSYKEGIHLFNLETMLMLPQHFEEGMYKIPDFNLQEIINYYENMKDFFHSYNDYRFDDILNFDIEYMENLLYPPMEESSVMVNICP